VGPLVRTGGPVSLCNASPSCTGVRSQPFSIQHLILMTRVLTAVNLLAGGLACLLVSAELATAGELAATALQGDR
jgi:hypothetical protein